MKSNTILISTPQCTVVNIARTDAKLLKLLPRFAISKIDNKTGKVHEFLFNVHGKKDLPMDNYDLPTIAKNVVDDIMDSIVAWGERNGFEFSFQTELTDEQKASVALAEQQSQAGLPGQWPYPGGSRYQHTHAGMSVRGFGSRQAGYGNQQTEAVHLANRMHNALEYSYKDAAVPADFSIRGRGYHDKGIFMSFPLGYGFVLFLNELRNDAMPEEDYLAIQLAGNLYTVSVDQSCPQNIGTGSNQLKLLNLNMTDLQGYMTTAIKTFAPYLIQESAKDGRLLIVSVPKPKAAKKTRAK